MTLVIYSDFECPFCTKGLGTVNELLKRYENKVRYIYKHLPLPFHSQAMITSQYYEAIRLQSEEKAWKFHDKVYQEQRSLGKGEAFLKEKAKEVGADMGKLAKDLNSEKVKQRISEDQQEAEKFGFQGTPGFLLNGVPVKGAYPVEYFEKIIALLKEKGKISI